MVDYVTWSRCPRMGENMACLQNNSQVITLKNISETSVLDRFWTLTHVFCITNAANVVKDRKKIVGSFIIILDPLSLENGLIFYYTSYYCSRFSVATRNTQFA